MGTYILSLDQGTSVASAIIVDRSGKIISHASKEFEQYLPKSGWIEHDAKEIWYSIASVAEEAIEKAGLKADDIAAIGISNQRETTILWDRETGKPISNAIVWQDRRTSRICDQLKEAGHEEIINEKTGLQIDAYFSATKIKWLLDHTPGAREKADEGKIAFGTVDSWLIWKFTKGKRHITDVSNASRTMLFNINSLEWDKELLDILNIPSSVLPEVCSSSEVYETTHPSIFCKEIPLASVIGDQQAALFGQLCLEKGMVKNTYNTGCFILINTGDKPVTSNHKLLTTIAWKIGDQVTYALEGSIFIGGSVIQWLRDGLSIINSFDEIEDLALTEKDNGGIFFVPSFTGLGAPYWDQYARGTFWGLNIGTTNGHIARATLEAIALRSADVIKAMEADLDIKITEVRADGSILNDTMLQFQSDILGVPVIQPEVTEMTMLGAAFLAGLAVKYWENIDELKNQRTVSKVFQSSMKEEEVKHLLKYWEKAIERSKSWLDPLE